MSVAFVANAHGGNTNATSKALTVTSTTAGNLLVVVVGFDPDTVVITGVADNAGNTYVQASGARTAHDQSQSSDIWYCKNCLGGATVVTVTAGTQYVHFIMSVYEFSGARTSGVFDSANAAQMTTTQTISPAVTPGSSGTVLVAVGYNTAVLYTGASGAWVAVNDDSVTGFVSAYLLAPALSSQQCSFLPVNGGTFAWAASTASFFPPVVPAVKWSAELVF